MRVSSRISVFLLSILPCTLAQAVPFTAGNIVATVQLSSTGFAVREYTRAGVMVQQISVPRPGNEDPRDITVGTDGRLYLFNGTFAPYLSIYNPQTDQWTSTNFARWSLANNVTYGGIGVNQSSIFTSDYATSGDTDGVHDGIVKWDLSGDNPSRFALGSDCRDLSMGLDGKLYALLVGNGHLIRAFDPATLQIVNSVDHTYPNFPDLGGNVTTIAGDANGNIYIMDIFGPMRKVSPEGAVLTTRNWWSTNQFNYVCDIELGADGIMVLSNDDRKVLVTDQSLSPSAPVTIFTVGTYFDINGTFVALVPPNVSTSVPNWELYE